MPNSGVGPRARTLRALTALLAAVSLVGCTTAAAGPAPTGTDLPVVLTTFTVTADIARVVGGPDVHVESVTAVGAEVHGYEPTPDDLRRAAGADLLLVNGLGLEAWVEALLAPLDLPSVVLTEQVTPVAVDPADPEGPVNPHAWMSPLAGRAYVTAVAEALSGLAPEHAEDFRARAATYSAELTTLHAELTDRLSTIDQDRRLLVTCEGAFTYLARDAGLDEAFLWPVNAERQGTPRQVAGVIDEVRRSGVPAVFCESTVSATAQRQVARETGARFAGTLYVDSLSRPDGPVPTYLDLLRHDVDLVVAGLGGRS